mgnify:FL=1
MNMKKWMTPTAVEENFLANNTVSTCYKIACNTDVANNVEWSFYGLSSVAHYHRKEFCGNAEHQVLVTNKKNEIVGMKELHADNGVLDCTLYTDVKYDKEMAPSDISKHIGKTVYWKTHTGAWPVTIEYHHQGTVQLVDAAKQNMS